MIKIIDNVLNDLHFAKLKTNLLDNLNFPWYLGKIVDEKSNSPYQFCHIFYGEQKINSNYFTLIEPILQILKIKNLIRIKANIILKTSEIVKHDFHIDTKAEKKFNTAIYYLNDNNGFTEFENGKIVKSISNRLVIFDGKIKHRGTSCSDNNYRSVINFNYLKKDMMKK